MGRRAFLYRFRPRSAIARGLAGAGLAGALAVAAVMGFIYHAPVYPPSFSPPEQPIRFSHKLHAGDLEIDCQYCHIYAAKAEFAGVPPLTKCMNCHVNLTIKKEPVRKLKTLAESKDSGQWIRIYKLPDHVWFNHKRHIAKDIKCAVCHGPVETMEVTYKAVTHQMGFCLDCHQGKNAPTDCWTCHT
ncbi:MAG: cytochrome c3 family protein [Nitrospinae bacterium]|nr:cytochrome c3 family protein [Nitrospinota bacterium]